MPSRQYPYTSVPCIVRSSSMRAVSASFAPDGENMREYSPVLDLCWYGWKSGFVVSLHSSEDTAHVTATLRCLKRSSSCFRTGFLPSP